MRRATAGVSHVEDFTIGPTNKEKCETTNWGFDVNAWFPANAR